MHRVSTLTASNACSHRQVADAMRRTYLDGLQAQGRLLSGILGRTIGCRRLVGAALVVEEPDLERCRHVRCILQTQGHQCLLCLGIESMPQQGSSHNATCKLTGMCRCQAEGMLGQIRSDLADASPFLECLGRKGPPCNALCIVERGLMVI